jgi:hypothetical protein
VRIGPWRNLNPYTKSALHTEKFEIRRATNDIDGPYPEHASDTPTHRLKLKMKYMANN